MANSAEKYLGDNVEGHDKLLVKVKDVSKTIEKKRTQFENMKGKIDKLTALNSKLANGYELSLKIVVDVSKLLKNYTKMFDDIETMLGSLDKDMGAHQLDIKYISELTKKSIEKIRTDFNAQYPTIIEALEKDGNKENVASARKLKVIVNEISEDAKEMEAKLQLEEDLKATQATERESEKQSSSWFGGSSGNSRRGGNRGGSATKSTKGGSKVIRDTKKGGTRKNI